MEVEDAEGGGRGGDGGRRTGRTGKGGMDPRCSTAPAVGRTSSTAPAVGRKSSTAPAVGRTSSTAPDFDGTRSTAPAVDPRRSNVPAVDHRRSSGPAVDPRRSFLCRPQNNNEPADMDKGWMESARSSTQYSDSVRKFIEFGVRNSGENGPILCPCNNCGNRYWQGVEDVHDHLICDGFMSGYTSWIFHGECLGAAEPTLQPSTSQEAQDGDCDEMEQLLVDGFGIYDSACLDAHSDSDEESEEDYDEAAETVWSWQQWEQSKIPMRMH